MGFCGAGTGIAKMVTHSLLYWTEKKAMVHQEGAKLTFNMAKVLISWVGVGPWCGLNYFPLKIVEKVGLLYIIILYARGNDSGACLMKQIKIICRDCLHLWSLFPHMIIAKLGLSWRGSGQ